MPSSISSSEAVLHPAFVPIRQTASDRPGVAQPVPVRDIPRFIRLYREGRLPVHRLIDGYVGFDEVNAGFDKLQDVKAIRQILTPHGNS